MKAGLLALAALSAMTAAQPLQRELPAQVKREVVQVTQIDYVTETAPAVVVYVDQNGKPLEESDAAVQRYQRPSNQQPNYSGHSWEAPAAAPTTSEAPASAAPVTSAAPVVVPTTTSPAAEAPTSTTAQQQPASTPASEGSSGLGISYAAFRVGSCGDNTCPGVCKTSSEISADIAALSGYPLIRLYGTECNQISIALGAISSSQKLFLGLYDLTSQAGVVSDISSVESQVAGQWSKIDTISVGNEHVAGGMLASTVLNYVALARTAFKLVGYTGTVTTVDTVQAYVDNNALCSAAGSDSNVYANIHAFFGGGAAADAGKNVQSEVNRLSSSCGGKSVVVTESGWPWKGESDNQAIPSPSDQATAISSLKAAFSKNFILFSAYNDYWKQNNAYTYGAEQYWGIHGDSHAN